MLDLFCLIAHDYDEKGEEGCWTHADVKQAFYNNQEMAWWSNRRSVENTLLEMRGNNSPHWRYPPGWHLHLQFADTDNQGFSALAQEIIETCLLERVWVHREGDERAEPGDDRYIWHHGEPVEIRYLD